MGAQGVGTSIAEEAMECGGLHTGWYHCIIVLSLGAAEDETVVEMLLCNSKEFLGWASKIQSSQRAVHWRAQNREQSFGKHQRGTYSRSVDEFLSWCLCMPLWGASNVWGWTAHVTELLQFTCENYTNIGFYMKHERINTVETEDAKEFMQAEHRFWRATKE